MLAMFPALNKHKREHPVVTRAAPGLASCSSHGAHSGSADLKAHLRWLVGASATSCGRALHAPVQTNQWPCLSHEGVRMLTYQASVLKPLRNVGCKGHVLALTKLGSRKVFVLRRPKHDSV